MVFGRPFLLLHLFIRPQWFLPIQMTDGLCIKLCMQSRIMAILCSQVIYYEDRTQIKTLPEYTDYLKIKNRDVVVKYVNQ